MVGLVCRLVIAMVPDWISGTRAVRSFLYNGVIVVVQVSCLVAFVSLTLVVAPKVGPVVRQFLLWHDAFQIGFSVSMIAVVVLFTVFVQSGMGKVAAVLVAGAVVVVLALFFV